MTTQDFANKLSDMYHQAVADDPKYTHITCLLPWELRHQAKDLQALLPQLRVVVKNEQFETFVEVWKR